MAVRLICGATGMICNYYAIDHMNLSDANMLNKLSPFFAILASVVILGEIPEKSDWLVLCIVFSGALLIMKPSLNVQFVYALIALGGAAGAGIAYSCVRKLGKMGIPGPFIVFAFSTFTCLICLPYSLLRGVRLTPWQLGCLLMAGISAAFAQFSITTAYQRAEAKKISVFEYTQIPFAALLGFLFLGQIPDILSVAGYIIIIGGSVLKHRLNRG
jgi:drug/metabolite transporter (DMT)-like permease